MKLQGGEPSLKIGNNNVFREYVTVHVATGGEGRAILRNNNNILAYSHVVHDWIIGNKLVMSSHAALGGHVVMEDNVNIGWDVGVHQFCWVGAHSMIGFSSRITQDIPPFMLVDSNPLSVRTFNKIGLERAGFTGEDIDVVKAMYTILYRNGYNRSQAMERLQNTGHADHPLVSYMLDFIGKSVCGLVS